ncbi:Protein of unknown function [Pyronema omphalodes CBS 100304]|uniref:F-box domain-containing protein n=1 Tax=Pyronema omphalodes (strain CBS 100304) TaxID=1076935 RepID=U4KV29_PYROM|nr:Protein of unknown function [Pyronema omphalodes CBS 100304]
MSLADTQHLYQSLGSDYEPPIQQADMYMPENYAKFHDDSFGPGQFTDALFSEDALSGEDFEDPAIDDLGQDAVEHIQQAIHNVGQSSIGLIQQEIDNMEQNVIDPIQRAIEIAERALVDTSVYLNDDVALEDAYKISNSSGPRTLPVAVGLSQASAHINRAITFSPLLGIDGVIEPRIRYVVDNHTKQLVSNLSPESLQSILLETLSRLPPAYKEDITTLLRASSSTQEYCDDGNANTGNFKLPIECIANILKYLSLQDICTFLLGTCKALRVLFDYKDIWSNVIFDCAESAICRRLWVASLTILSLTDLPAALDGNKALKSVLPYAPNLKKLRIDGQLDEYSLIRLSGLRRYGRFDETILGNNGLTHLSLTGKFCIEWDSLAKFDTWYPELEFLQIGTIIRGDLEKWDKYRIEVLGGDFMYRHPDPGEIPCFNMQKLRFFVVDNIGEATAKKEVKLQENVHAAYLWALINGSWSTLEHIEINRGEEKLSPEAKAAATKAGNFKSHRSSLSWKRAALPNLYPRATIPYFNLMETPPSTYLPRLRHLFISQFEIPWNFFVPPPITVIGNGPDGQQQVQVPSQPHLFMMSIRKVVFFRCEGLPGGIRPTATGIGLKKRWVAELKDVWPRVKGYTETIDPKRCLGDNIGIGDW